MEQFRYIHNSVIIHKLIAVIASLWQSFWNCSSVIILHYLIFQYILWNHFFNAFIFLYSLYSHWMEDCGVIYECHSDEIQICIYSTHYSQYSRTWFVNIPSRDIMNQLNYSTDQQFLCGVRNLFGWSQARTILSSI